jgi:hypothetical protein
MNSTNTYICDSDAIDIDNDGVGKRRWRTILQYSSKWIQNRKKRVAVWGAYTMRLLTFVMENKKKIDDTWQRERWII